MLVFGLASMIYVLLGSHLPIAKEVRCFPNLSWRANRTAREKQYSYIINLS